MKFANLISLAFTFNQSNPNLENALIHWIPLNYGLFHMLKVSDKTEISWTYPTSAKPWLLAARSIRRCLGRSASPLARPCNLEKSRDFKTSLLLPRVIWALSGPNRIQNTSLSSNLGRAYLGFGCFWYANHKILTPFIDVISSWFEIKEL